MKTVYTLALATSMLCLGGAAYAQDTAKPAQITVISADEGCAKKDSNAKTTRIILRSKDGKASSVDARAQLAEARKEIAEEDSLSPEMKAKVLKSLDQSIAQMKGPNPI